MLKTLTLFARKPAREKWAAVKATICATTRRAVRKTVVEPARYLSTAIALSAQVREIRSNPPKLMLFHGLSPGDDLICSAALRELRKRRGSQALAIVSNYPELFSGNNDADYVFPAGNHHGVTTPPISVYRHLVRITGGEFKRVTYTSFDGIDRDESPSRHIIAELCASAGIMGSISLRPYINLTDTEKSRESWANGLIVVQSSGMSARYPIGNKQWYPERFQAVVDQLHREWNFVQLGAAEDPPLKHVKDLRGATTIRKTAAILYQARLYFGTVGFLMHLARAVECPSVIVFGGREAPWQSGYTCNVNLYSPVPCAPCWRWNSCDFDRKCMKNISIDDAVSAVRQMLDRPRSPLGVDVFSVRAQARTDPQRRGAIGDLELPGFGDDLRA
jgi:hypothetical protein